MEKNILIFGDSNTWGWDPNNTLATINRFPRNVRWPGVMQNILGDDYRVIDEGLNGRTTVWDDPIEEYRCGKQQLIPILDSHSPLDLVIIFLGTNDLKSRYDLTAEDVSFGAGLLVQKTLQHLGNQTKILLVAPPPLGKLESGIFAQMFKGAYETSLEFAKYFEIVAKTYNVEFINAGDYVVTSTKDSVHLEAEEHKKLGQSMAKKVKEILG